MGEDRVHWDVVWVGIHKRDQAQKIGLRLHLFRLNLS